MSTTFISYLGTVTGCSYLLGGTNGAVVGFTVACVLTLAWKIWLWL